jgi:hypothetical protein
MANLAVKNAAGDTKYLKTAGAGSDEDPHIPEHSLSGTVTLGAGTAGIGKLTANSGVDIGDVDVTSIAAGSNLIGKVSIDQVTANANEVVVKSVPSAAVASGAIASGAIASGAVASGAFASGAVGSGAVASGAIASGAVASGAIASGAVAAGAFALGAISVPTAIVHGQKTVTTAGTEVALGSSTTLYSGVRIKALHANTGWIYVGANPVTSSTGFVLDAGEEVFLEVANLATVYIDSSVNGEGVSYIGA